MVQEISIFKTPIYWREKDIRDFCSHRWIGRFEFSYNITLMDDWRQYLFLCRKCFDCACRPLAQVLR